jgi:hypothetical protein
VTTAAHSVIPIASLHIALAIALPAQAGYGFALAISPEIRLQPGSHLHLPALITHIGTLDIVFGPNKPDATPSKLMDASRPISMGWQAWIPYREGLAKACGDLRNSPSRAH